VSDRTENDKTGKQKSRVKDEIRDSVSLGFMQWRSSDVSGSVVRNFNRKPYSRH